MSRELIADPRAAAEPEAASLYAAILGSSWMDLPSRLRQIHGGGNVGARGCLRITQAPRSWASLLRRLAGLPPPAEQCTVELSITGSPRQEHWRRSFGDFVVSTVQSEARGVAVGERARLAERFRGLELTFQLEVIRGEIHFRQERAALAAGWLRIPLPRRLGPVVAAREWGGDDGRIHVDVVISLPLAPELVRYHGWVEIQEETS